MLIGCLPTYGQVGTLAPLLLILLRFIQGIGLGGEWGGAVLMVVEHARAHRRGLYGSLVQVGFPIGVAASTGVFIPLTALPAEDLLSWGWRIRFLLSILLVAVGLFIRLRLTETPAFRRVQRSAAVARRPAMEVLTRTPRVVPYRGRHEDIGTRLGLCSDGVFNHLRHQVVESAEAAYSERHHRRRAVRAGHAAAGALAVRPRRPQIDQL